MLSSEEIKLVLLGDPNSMARVKNAWQAGAAEKAYAEKVAKIANTAVGVQVWSMSAEDARDPEFVKTCRNEADKFYYIAQFIPENFQTLEAFTERVAAEYQSAREYLKINEDQFMGCIIYARGADFKAIDEEMAFNVNFIEIDKPDQVVAVLNNEARLIMEARKVAIVEDDDVILKPLASAGSSLPRNKPPRSRASYLSHFSGALVGAILGAITAVVVYNPLASLFGAVSQFAHKKSLKNFGLLLISPIWGPLKGVFYHGFYQQGLNGLQQGFKRGLYAVVDVPRQATSKENDALHPRISSRNIIASLIIAGFIAVAVVGVLFPLTFGIATILPTVLATLQLTNVSTAVLGLIAGATTFVAAALLYSIVVNTYDALAKSYQKGTGLFGKRGKATSAESEPLLFSGDEASTSNKASQGLGIRRGISKLAGAVTGAIIGGLTAAFLYNPVASLYTAFRITWRAENIKRKVSLTIALILSPIWMPLVAICKRGIYGQGKRGWDFGFSNILGFGEDFDSAYRHVVTNSRVSRRDFVASLVVIGLVVAAVLAVILPPASLFIGIPALAATIGMGSVGTAVLAVIAAAATFVVSTLLYGIGSQLADVYIEHRNTVKAGTPMVNVNKEATAGSTYTLLPPSLNTTATLSSKEEIEVISIPSKDSFSLRDWLPEICGGRASKTGMSTRKLDEQVVSTPAPSATL